MGWWLGLIAWSNGQGNTLTSTWCSKSHYSNDSPSPLAPWECVLLSLSLHCSSDRCLMVLELPVCSWAPLQGAGCNSVNQTTQGCRKRTQFLAQFFSSIFLLLQLWHWFSPQTANQKMPRISLETVPNPDPHIRFHFHTVKEDLWTEV